MKRIKPSDGLIALSVYAKIQSRPVTTIIIGTSLFTIALVQLMGRMRAVTPRIKAMFIMFEPTTLPSESAGVMKEYIKERVNDST